VRGITAIRQKILPNPERGHAKHGNFMDKMKLGGGGRYEKLVSSLESKGVKDPKALAASIGRKKLGRERFQSLAAKGRRRAERQSSYA